MDPTPRDPSTGHVLRHAIYLKIEDLSRKCSRDAGRSAGTGHPWRLPGQRTEARPHHWWREAGIVVRRQGRKSFLRGYSRTACHRPGGPSPRDCRRDVPSRSSSRSTRRGTPGLPPPQADRGGLPSRMPLPIRWHSAGETPEPVGSGHIAASPGAHSHDRSVVPRHCDKQIGGGGHQRHGVEFSAQPRAAPEFLPRPGIVTLELAHASHTISRQRHDELVVIPHANHERRAPGAEGGVIDGGLVLLPDRRSGPLVKGHQKRRLAGSLINDQQILVQRRDWSHSHACAGRRPGRDATVSCRRNHRRRSRRKRSARKPRNRL